MDKNSIPEFPLKLFKWFCKPEYHGSIEGDLLELFDRRVENLGFRKAKWLLLKDVLLLFRPGIIRQFNIFPNRNLTIMLKNYIKVAFRQMSRQKGYAVIKIGGFALGIAACLLIALFIKDELSYDQHYPDVDRIYRIYADFKVDGETISGTSFPPPLARTILEEFPEVEATGRFNAWPGFDGPGSNQFRRADQQQSTYEEGFAYADQSIFDIFQFPMLYGDLSTALSKPNTIVITEDKARKYFPNENPIGKTVILNDNDQKPFEISGVLAKLPAQSFIQYDFYLSLEDHEFWPGEQNIWPLNIYDCFLKLKPNIDVIEFEQKLEHIIRNFYAPKEVEAGYAESIEDFVSKVQLKLQPVNEVYLKSTSMGILDSYNHGDMRFVWLFGMIAFFILLLAAINFINLSTAKSANRAKEVGLRKVLGSLRRSLIHRFLTESLLYAFSAFVAGVLLAYCFLPFFNQMAAKSIAIPWMEGWFIVSLVLAWLIVGFLAGLYPAFYLSNFRPVETIKGKLTLGSKGQGFQNSLIVFQFTTAIVLIVGTLVINRQMNFILNKNLGFEKDQVVLLHGAQTLGDKVLTMKEQLLQLPEVKRVSISDFLPVKGGQRFSIWMWIKGYKDVDKMIGTQRWRVDHDYLKTMGIKLVSGRDFNIDMPSDSQATIINQAFAKKLNLENPIGTVLSNGVFAPVTIIGVVEDFHFESFKDEITPLCFVLESSPEIISVKVSAEDINPLLAGIERTWNQFLPNQPIRYNFLDDRFAAMYEDVKRMGWIFSSFSVLAIVLACLGMFAMAAFMAEQRSKEMSIRKVLGASVSNIFRLLTQNFLRLTFISLCIATPMAWYFMNRWLEDYNYRMALTADVFILAGAVVLLIALLTISYQAIKTATVNPAEVMRKE